MMNRIPLRFVPFNQFQTALTSLLLLAGNAGNYLHPRCTAGCREEGTYRLVFSLPTRTQEIRPSLHCTTKHGVWWLCKIEGEWSLSLRQNRRLSPSSICRILWFFALVLGALLRIRSIANILVAAVRALTTFTSLRGISATVRQALRPFMGLSSMALSLASYYERCQIYKVSPKFILVPWFGLVMWGLISYASQHQGLYLLGTLLNKFSVQQLHSSWLWVAS